MQLGGFQQLKRAINADTKKYDRQYFEKSLLDGPVALCLGIRSRFQHLYPFDFKGKRLEKFNALKKDVSRAVCSLPASVRASVAAKCCEHGLRCGEQSPGLSAIILCIFPSVESNSLAGFEQLTKELLAELPFPSAVQELYRVATSKIDPAYLVSYFCALPLLTWRAEENRGGVELFSEFLLSENVFSCFDRKGLLHLFSLLDDGALSEALVSRMPEKVQPRAAEALVQQLIEASSFQDALGVAEKFSLENMAAREAYLDRLVLNRQYLRARKLCGSNRALQERLTRHACRVSSVFGRTVAAQFGLASSTIAELADTESCAQNCFSLPPRVLVCFVSDYDGLSRALLLLRREIFRQRALQPLMHGCFCRGLVGLDIEWRPVMGKEPVRPALLQLACGTVAVLIDLLAGWNWSLFDVQLLRVWWECDGVVGYGVLEDLETLERSFECRCFDSSRRPTVCDLATLLAPSFHGIGLSRLCKRAFGRPLNKYEQVSDWEARPLSQSQENYASLDAWVPWRLFSCMSITCRSVWSDKHRHVLRRVACNRFTRPSLCLYSWSLSAMRKQYHRCPVDTVQQLLKDRLGEDLMPVLVWKSESDALFEFPAVKTLALLVGSERMLVVALATTTVDLEKVSAQFSDASARLATHEECFHLFGHAPGHFPPVDASVPVLVDHLVCHEPMIVCGGGNSSAFFVTSPEVLLRGSCGTVADVAVEGVDSGNPLKAVASVENRSEGAPACSSRSYRFLCDSSLSRVCRWLRVLGVDCLMCKEDAMGLVEAIENKRILLTRNKKICALREAAGNCLLMNSMQLKEQLGQIFDHFSLKKPAACSPESVLMLRCVRCNSPKVAPVERSAVEGRVSDRTMATAPSFAECFGCGHIFWGGGIYSTAQTVVAELKEEAE